MQYKETLAILEDGKMFDVTGIPKQELPSIGATIQTKYGTRKITGYRTSIVKSVHDVPYGC